MKTQGVISKNGSYLARIFLQHLDQEEASQRLQLRGQEQDEWSRLVTKEDGRRGKAQAKEEERER